MRRVVLGGLLALTGCLGNGSERTPTDAPPLFAPLQADPIDFGDVVVGETVALRATIRNPVDGFGTQIDGFSVPSADFRFPGFDFPQLPFFLGAGKSLSLTVEYTPTREGPRDAGFIATHTAGQPVLVDLLGNGIPGELPTAFGDVAVDPVTRETAELTVDLPANAISFTIEVLGAGPIQLVSLSGPGGHSYLPGAYSTAHLLPTADNVHFQVPNSADAAAQLVAGGGTYRFRLANTGGTATTLTVRVDVEQRTTGEANVGRIPLNVFLAAGLALTPNEAATDPRLQAVLAEANALFAQGGAGFSPIRYITLPNAAFDTIAPSMVPQLLMQSALATDVGVNVFLVLGATGGERGGSPALPGGKTPGTPFSGVYAVYDDGLPDAEMGARIAHEIGHHLGLPDSTSPQSVMNPTTPGPVLSLAQAHIVLRHVLVEPGTP